MEQLDGGPEQRPPAIELRHIVKAFDKNKRVVDDCSLVVEAGTFVSLLGPSGCGKTTLLRIIGGFEQQDQGQVRIHGKAVDSLVPNRRDVNTVFQRYALFPHRSVAENIAFPLEVQKVVKSGRRARVEEMLELVQLSGIQDRFPAQISGGQAQRVALARALIGRPQVLLLDEPLAALDLKLRKAMQLELRRIQQELDTTFLYVTHDQEEALTMSDKVVVMNGGRIEQEGTPEDIYLRPESVFASHFIGETNLLEAEVRSVGNGVVTVVTGQHEFTGRATGVSQGERATISIRPERLSLHGAREGCPDINQAKGVVQRRVFLGSAVRYIVEVSEDIDLVVQLNQGAADSFQEGETVELCWGLDDMVILGGAS